MSSAPSILVSEQASAHIHKQVCQAQSQFLRLGVKPSGCNGYSYTLDFLEHADEDDHHVVINDQVTICIKQAEADLVSGTEIDIVTQGLNSALVFKNSKATSYCGCGESFAFDSPETLDQGSGAAVPSLPDAGLAVDAMEPKQD